MLDRNKTREIVEKLTAYTKNYAVVNIYDNGERLSKFANSQIVHNVETEDVLVALTVYSGKKETTCSANLYDDDSLRQLAAKADGILGLMPEGECERLPLGEEAVPESQNDVRLAETFDVEGRVGAIRRCVETLEAGFSAAGIFALYKNMHAFGNSDGVFRYHYADYVHFDTTVTHKSGATGYGGMTATRLEDCDAEGAFKVAYDKAQAAVNPVYAEVGAYTVILEPAAVDGLLRFVATGLNGDNYLGGMSYASGRLGQKLFGDNFTLRDDVDNPETIQCFFDAEGRRRTPITLIENGAVKQVVHDGKTAFRAGARPTGHALGSARGSSHPANMVFYASGGYPINLVMDGGDSTLEEMIASTKKGILVTHFHYMNYVDPATAQVTGLTRDGTFLIEDGKIKAPIHNMRFTESMLDAFSNISMLSRKRERFGTSLVPAAKIENFHFTSGQK